MSINDCRAKIENATSGEKIVFEDKEPEMMNSIYSFLNENKHELKIKIFKPERETKTGDRAIVMIMVEKL